MARPLDLKTSAAAAARYDGNRTGKRKVGRCVLQTRAEPPSKTPFSINNLRVREIEQLIKSRHGSIIPQTDDADLFVKAVAYALNAYCFKTGDDLDAALRGWCHRWCPWVLPQAARILGPILHSLSGRRFDLSADAVAHLLVVTNWERTGQKFKTIGACDIPADIRKGIARSEKRINDAARQTEKRRKAGVQPRESWLSANSISNNRPWEAEGVSRATWYRERGKTGPSLVGINSSASDTLVSTVELGSPPPNLALTEKLASLKSQCANDPEEFANVEREPLRKRGASNGTF